MTIETQLQKMLRDSWTAADDDISCNEAEAHMQLAASEGLADDVSQRRFPALWRHMAVCSDCAETYQLVMELTVAEAAGDLVALDSLPPVPKPGSNRSSLWQRIQSALQLGLSDDGIEPGMVVRSVGTAQSEGRVTLEDNEPIEVNFADEQYVLEVTVVPAEGGSSQLIDMHCVLIADSEAYDFFAGVSVHLADDEVPDSFRVDEASETGTVTFTNLRRSMRYLIYFEWKEQAYVFSDLVVP